MFLNTYIKNAYPFLALAAVNVNLATNSATGTATGTDTLANINQARGSNYNDTLTGSDRTDVTEQFEGRTGDDVIDGAGGLDIARYDNASGAVSVSLATGSSSGADGNDTLSGIEGVRGSKFDDALTGGNAASDALEFFNGMAGNDTIDGGTGFDRVDYQLPRGPSWSTSPQARRAALTVSTTSSTSKACAARRSTTR